MKIFKRFTTYLAENSYGSLSFAVLVVFFAIYAIASAFFVVTYSNDQGAIATEGISTSTEPVDAFIVTHVKTPEPLKAVYMTSCYAGSKELRDGIVKLIESTELNSIVIDIKDYTGKISYYPEDPELLKFVSDRCRASDMREFVKILHDKNIYVIGRVTVFQDPFLATLRPELAVKKKSDTSSIWKDRKGISFVDPGSKEVWEHNAKIAQASYDIGFDEINFDYIRFPSDGNMTDIYFPFSDGKAKSDVMHSFFKFVKNKFSGTGIVTSADLFGMTTTNTDDLGIGQVLEYALENFDYVAPMVYPSHYPAGWYGFKKPAENPYEVIKISMTKAAERAVAASTTPLKLRPWIQDFNLGAIYTPDMVRAQFRATYDSGLTSWLIWDPSNRYTSSRLTLKKEAF